MLHINKGFGKRDNFKLQVLGYMYGYVQTHCSSTVASIEPILGTSLFADLRNHMGIDSSGQNTVFLRISVRKTV